MKIGLFTEFSYAGKSEQQTYAEVLEQIAVADELVFDFFSTLRGEPRPWPGALAQDFAPQTYREVAGACPWGSTTEGCGKDLFSCSPFPLGFYVAAAQRRRRRRFPSSTRLFVEAAMPAVRQI